MVINKFQLNTIFNEIIGATLGFANEPFSFSYEEFSGKIDRLLTNGVINSDGIIDPRDFDDARFAVCAWIDEVVLNTAWIHKEKWRNATLQERYYNTTNAGDEFFLRLDAIGSEQTGLLSIFYTCLLLGFRGRYCKNEDAALIERIIKAIKDKININQKVEKREIITSYAKRGVVRKYERFIYLKSILLVTLSITIVGVITLLHLKLDSLVKLISHT